MTDISTIEASNPVAAGTTDSALPHLDLGATSAAIAAAGQEAMNPDAENRQALFERAILDVLDLRSHATKIYSRQVRNPEVRRQAYKTRKYAERRVAQLLIAAERAGLRYMGRPEKGAAVGAPTELITLEKLGITRKQSQTWQRLARMGDVEFEAWLDAELAKKSQRHSRSTNTNAPPGGAGALVPIRPGIQLPGKVTRTGWRLPKDMSFEDWLTCGQVLDLAEGAAQWWRGDWWSFGSGRQWGEGEALAEKAGVNYGAVRVYGSVARAFELSRRLNNLSFGHHQSAMAAGEARYEWLRRAETECWSVAELRAAIAQAKRLKVARQAELAKDGEKDGPQSEPTPSDQGPSPSPQRPPSPERAAKEPMWSNHDAPAARDLASELNVDVVPEPAPEPTPPPNPSTLLQAPATAPPEPTPAASKPTPSAPVQAGLFDPVKPVVTRPAEQSQEVSAEQQWRRDFEAYGAPSSNLVETWDRNSPDWEKFERPVKYLTLAERAARNWAEIAARIKGQADAAI